MRVSKTLDNFILGPDSYIIGFFSMDSQQASVFFVRRPLTLYHDVYDFDTNINEYINVTVLDTFYFPMYIINPTLDCVHKTPSNNVKTPQ